MSLRIFIVDDEAPARARLRTLLSDIAGSCPHELVGEADSAQTALDALAEAQPDLLLLDVQMPGMTGIEFAAHLSMLPHPPVIIFVTAFDHYALSAFDLHAVDYLLKPVRASRLAEALARAGKRRMSTAFPNDEISAAGAALRSKRRHFPVWERNRLLLVPVVDVLYLKAEMKYITLHTGTRNYLIEESLVSIEEELAADFIRVHRNALVARKAIIGFERGSVLIDQDGANDRAQESWEVILEGSKERLPISRRQWTLVKALLRQP